MARDSFQRAFIKIRMETHHKLKILVLIWLYFRRLDCSFPGLELQTQFENYSLAEEMLPHPNFSTQICVHIDELLSSETQKNSIERVRIYSR